MTDPAALRNELDQLAAIAENLTRQVEYGSAADPYPPEVWDARHAVRDRIVAAGYPREVANAALVGWIITQRPIWHCLQIAVDEHH